MGRAHVDLLNAKEPHVCACVLARLSIAPAAVTRIEQLFNN